MSVVLVGLAGVAYAARQDAGAQQNAPVQETAPAPQSPPAPQNVPAQQNAPAPQSNPGTQSAPAQNAANVAPAQDDRLQPELVRLTYGLLVLAGFFGIALVVELARGGPVAIESSWGGFGGGLGGWRFSPGFVYLVAVLLFGAMSSVAILQMTSRAANANGAPPVNNPARTPPQPQPAPAASPAAK